METKIYIQVLDDFIEVRKNVFRAFYNSCSSERKRLQQEGKCFCPKKMIWKCDCDCINCSFSCKPETDEIYDGDLDKTENTPAEDATESQISMMALKQLIKKISVVYPDAETIIWMRYMGYSDREIQKIIHIPRRTFEYNIASALKQLNVHIDDYL
ncbi:MAG: hypothetical protein V3G42_12660 [Oscillospiraceae bacterium]